MTSFEVKYILARNPQDLAEVYQVRINAWKTSGYLNKEDYPNGWSDSLDENGLVWAAKVGSRIIGSCRTNLFQNPNDVDYSRAMDLITFCNSKHMNIKFPVAYNSRMVVLPECRGRGIASGLDSLRMTHLLRSNVATVIATTDLDWRRDSLISKGWEFAGSTHPEFDETGTLGVSHIVKLDLSIAL